MKLKVFYVFILLIISEGLMASNALTIEFNNIKSDQGQILYILFNNKKGFPDKIDNSFRQGNISLKDYLEKGLVINDLPVGDYALSAFHDENNNNILDTTMIGIPKEPFAFSNNPTILFGPPKFKNSKFNIAGNTSLKISFKNF